MAKRKNCWEYMKCGREPSGANADELGVCPAAAAKALDRVHGGKNAGRCCWVVAGTFCSGEVQGTFAKKYVSCTQCDFYKLVLKEEGAFLNPIAALIEKLKEQGAWPNRSK